MPQIWQRQPLFPELRHFEQNGVHHFILIGRHLESFSSVKKGRPTNFGPIRAFFYRVIVLTSQVATFERSQTAKYKTEPFLCKIGRGILNLVALALTVTELFNKVCEQV